MKAWVITTSATFLLLTGGSSRAQDGAHPLEPPDRSTPRAALRTFLESADRLAAFVKEEYVPSPTRAGFFHMLELSQEIVSGLDLGEVPPTARRKAGGAAALALYETLNRIEIPPWNAIPGAGEPQSANGEELERWVLPHTEIALVRASDGAQNGAWLFSTDTVARADEFYQRVRDLPLRRPEPFPGLGDLLTTGGAWPVRLTWIEAMPAWLRAPLGGQAAWKWLALALLLTLYWKALRLVHRASGSVSEDRPFLRALARLGLPAYVLLATPIVAFLALLQINMFGAVASVIQLLATGVIFFAAAWLAWRAAPVIGEAIIAAPAISSESVDAYVVRIGTRLFAIAAVAVLLGMGAERLGVPLYGIIAGLGVGGLAIALAAQPTVENLIGSLSLFADKPVRVGDLCQYGEQVGWVESIGIRSTRIRGLDRKLTTIPNRDLANMPLVNFSHQDRRLINTVIGVRYETTAEQLRFLLARIREMLIAHPLVNRHMLHVRLIGFGPSSLDIEVFAYVRTRDRLEFFAIREDIFLRVMDIIEESGTSIAFPSQTLYFGRDPGVDSDRAQQAEQEVEKWRAGGRLPFPDFSRDQVKQFRATLEYPPPGSSALADEAK